MKVITLRKEEIYGGSLLLVNAQHPLRNQEAITLASVDSRFPDIQMESHAADILRLILTYISSEDEIVPVSGYRSLEEQTAIFEDSLKENGETFTRQFVALPGHSEHQTGLAIDLGLNQEEIDFICPEFPFEGICNTFRKTAPDYGLIQRYGKDKENITGISHEPWHFRYVGYPHSRIITDRNFALEEYIEWLKGYRVDNRYVFGCVDECDIEIFYVSADRDELSVSLPEHVKYQVSGNNVDGFIVTVWRA